MRQIVALVIGLATLTGCDTPAARSDTPPPAGAQPEETFTPDSVRATQLSEFRRGLPEPTVLTGGAGSREQLVQGFIQAAEARDTAALGRMVLSRAEFAWLYYPTSSQALPPYDLDPATLWLTSHTRSQGGLGKALEALGGKTLAYAGHRCDGEASHEGENLVYGPCVVRLVQARGDTAEARLFSLIVERRGRWKFVSYANKLD